LTDKFIIGIIGSPFGVKGFVKVRPLSGEIDHFLKLQSVTLSKDGKEQILEIDEINPVSAGTTAPNVHILFKGIDSPEKAKTLNGAQLITERDKAAPLAPGEFYIEDLKGLQVFSDKGDAVGHVLDIIEGGGGELIEIELTGGEKRLVPFRKEFISGISLEKSKIVLINEWILE
jgi:16S rRNA processing protein RimM